MRSDERAAAKRLLLTHDVSSVAKRSQATSLAQLPKQQSPSLSCRHTHAIVWPSVGYESISEQSVQSNQSATQHHQLRECRRLLKGHSRTGTGLPRRSYAPMVHGLWRGGCRDCMQSECSTVQQQQSLPGERNGVQQCSHTLCSHRRSSCIIIWTRCVCCRSAAFAAHSTSLSTATASQPMQQQATLSATHRCKGLDAHAAASADPAWITVCRVVQQQH